MITTAGHGLITPAIINTPTGITGLSSMATQQTSQNLYNDKELFDDADLNWYDYGFRNNDPQIGRFTQLDPLTDDYP